MLERDRPVQRLPGAELDVKLAKLKLQRVLDGFCALTPIEARSNKRAGVDEEGPGILSARGPGNADGDDGGLSALAVEVEDLDEWDVGELTARRRSLHSGSRALLLSTARTA